MYIELHARSAFSFLEGASVPEEFAGRCSELGMGAMALLDRDGVYGSPRFYLAANKLSVRAHIGAEITSLDGWRYPLLVESRAGYQNLCHLITRMKMRAKKGEGHVLPEEIAQYSEGLICLTGGDEGPLAHFLAHKGIEGVAAATEKLCEIFGRDNVYIELQRHFCREEEARNQAALEIARKHRLPVLATNGVCYAQPPQREMLDVFTCIRNHRTLADAGKLLARNSERQLKSPAEMARLFADLPEAIANTSLLSSRLQFTLNDLGYEFPKYPTPHGESQIQFLRQRTQDGMLWRYGAENDPARQQIARELDMIERLDLAGYFLIVWDIVRFCRDRNILVQGRGSAANSAVCYALGITAVDPVGMELLFERFLSDERGEWPDIDLDLPSGDQRERAIQYVYQRYGQLGAAMTANVITYRGRSAAREIGKALSFDPETLNRLTSLVGAWEYKDADDTLARHFRDAGLDFQHLQIRKFFELCVMAQDLPRHLGQHSGGMVVCQNQLDSVVPLEPASMPGRVVVQWDKEDCTDMGIVKVDLLGLGMMAVLEDSIQIIREDYGEEVDLGHLPPNDRVVYETLQKADTVGMFQIESRAQMAFLPRMNPKCFYDIVVQVGIIRPGPIVGKMVHPYLKRRQGREAPDSLHPSLEPVLARTLGVPLFQEQLLRMAMIAAGFTGGEAEELRRAFGFKRSEKRMKEVEIKLRAGMNRQGIEPDIQEKIIQSIVSFALYGFPESHAASFALIAYASAFLKCHYLAAFTAAILNNQPMGFYSPATLVKDAQRHGLKVKPIDVLVSSAKCTLETLPSISKEKFALRLGFNFVKGLRNEIASEIVAQRHMRPFTSIDDFSRRIPDMQKSELTALAEIGALNSICGERGHRRTALWQVDRAARPTGPLFDSPFDSQEEKLAGSYLINRSSSGHDFSRAENIDFSGALTSEDGEATRSDIHEIDSKNISSTSFSGIQANDESLLGGRSFSSDNKAGAQRPSSRGDYSASLSSKASGHIESPLSPMSPEERLVADFRGTGLTVGIHPMAHHRATLRGQGVRTATDLRSLPDGTPVRIAGTVITRQRPGTAKGFVFLSMEDETGIANAIVTPQLFAQNRVLIVHERFLLIDGILQNQDNVISVKAHRIQPLTLTRAAAPSHDFH